MIINSLASNRAINIGVKNIRIDKLIHGIVLVAIYVLERYAL